MKAEWSHFVDAEDITTTTIQKNISASPQERKDLANRFDLPAIERLEARISLRREEGTHVIYAKGWLEADIVQNCVVTDEEIKSQIKDEFDAWYEDAEQDVVSLQKIRRERQSSGHDNETEMPDERSEPEAIVDGRIDLGELVAQYLSLGINPYPTKKGLVLKDEAPAVLSEDDASLRRNPFAALKDWKANKKGEES